MSTTELLTPDELSNELGVAKRTLDQWRCYGRGPAFVRVGKRIRYRREDLDAWLAEQRVTPAASSSFARSLLQTETGQQI